MIPERDEPVILIDATALPADRGGVGRYVDELVAALHEGGAHVEVACQERDEDRYASVVGAARTHRIRRSFESRPGRMVWEQVGLPRLARRIDADVIHSPHYTFPRILGRGRAARVVTLHDATFYSHPEAHLPVKRRFFRWWTESALARSELVVVPSDATRQEIRAQVRGAAYARFAVAPHGANVERFRPPTEEEVDALRGWLGLGDRRFVAFLGTIEPRKNVPTLIEAWVSACRDLPDPPVLVLAGGEGWDPGVDAAIAAVPGDLQIIRPGFVPNELLPALLGGADVVVYPSLGEGFGLPVLEAMACAACVLTTAELAIPEVGGDAVEYAASPEMPDVATALRGLLLDDDRRAALRVAAEQRARDFTWGSSAQRHLTAYHRALAIRDGRRFGRALPSGDDSIRIIVVTYSSGPFLRALLDSAVLSDSRPLPVTLVDNGSSDGAPESAAQSDLVTLVQSTKNVGYGRAVNLGAKGVSEEWLLVANPDITFRQGAIDAMLAAARRWPNAGVLGPGMVTEGGLLYPSARNIPKLREGAAHAALGWIWPGNPWTTRYRREDEIPAEGIVGWVSGACMLIRRSVFEQVGGFDPRFFMYFEDVDLCERIARAGYDVVYVPSAVVAHHGGHATRRDPKAMSRAHHSSAYTYFAGHHQGTLAAPLRLAVRIGLEARYLASRRSERLFHGAMPTRAAELLDEPAGGPK